jgi:putative heme-binding domain-containing protein
VESLGVTRALLLAADGFNPVGRFLFLVPNLNPPALAHALIDLAKRHRRRLAFLPIVKTRLPLFTLLIFSLGRPASAQTPPAGSRPAPEANPPAAAPVTPPPAKPAPAADKPADAAPFFKEWKMEDLLPAIADLGKDRNYRNGGRVFQQAACGACHSFSTFWEGSGLAPDLTAVATKFTRDEILRSILEPSATINGQFFLTNFKLKSGAVIPGVLREVKDKKYRIAGSVAAPDVVIEIPEEDIVSEEPSPVSPMPIGLLYGFTKDQILDLMAFLDSGGNPDAPVYRK